MIKRAEKAHSVPEKKRSEAWKLVQQWAQQTATGRAIIRGWRWLFYFYLDKSSKRKRDFQQFQAEAGTNLHAILKHGPTQWLSLNNCVIRLLEQWEPLKAYFAAEYTNLNYLKETP
ncbi:hypothetical protein PoB_000911500 [Plakobranchus ocellatus]|uniref:Transposase n=1 Tax=Plakobranchus ocellatus TaxID=259542 RepID=A0AAV3YHQ9_9GAST|nr:hypothetical protein PoB_000911500 [Plakobranchus ocellatus]